MAAYSLAESDLAGSSGRRPITAPKTLTGGRRQVELVLMTDGEEYRERVTVPDEVPEWFTSSIDALNRVLALPAPLDSDDALPIDPRVAMAAMHLLADVMRRDTPAPAVTPTPLGHVTLHWSMRGMDMEVEIGPDGPTCLFYEDARSGEEWEGSIDSDRIRLTRQLLELTRRR